MKKFLILAAAVALAATATAQEHSVLATGRWWKLGVAEEGVYRITTSHIAALQGASVDSLAVYGRGAGMLAEQNALTPLDGMSQLAIEVTDRNGNGLFDAGDELLFYGEGAEGWSYDEAQGRWVFSHHAYARENCYYLTASCAAPRRIGMAAAVAADTLLTTHTVVAHVDNDLVNFMETGQLWMGERFSTAVPQRVVGLQLPGTAVSDVKLRWAVASTGTTSARFNLSTTGYNRQETLTGSTVYREVSGLIATAMGSYSFTLTFQPDESTGVGYLDYIELCAHAALTFRGPQQLLRNDQHLGGAATFALGNAEGVRVWAVGSAGGEREMALSDGRWSDATTEARTYVAFDGSAYLSPSAVTPLENQDLHGAEAADLVIVAHPDFVAQARRLATLHEVSDGLAVLTATDAEVYNEFSSGKQDPMAVRALLRNLKKNHPQQPPRYLILFGKGTYDNRNLLAHNLPTVVTYETRYSFDDDGMSFTSDDILGYLGETEQGLPYEALAVSVGRLPAKSADEADLLVDKIEGYIMRRDLQDETNRGDWRNYVALLADDADPGKSGDTVFAHSAEVIATALKHSLPQFNIDRLYADAYHQQSGAIGSSYPDLNNALRQRIDYGCLLLNYIGHGSRGYIGTERYIEFSDIAGFTNTDRLPLLVTSTCSYGHHDMVDELSGAEACVLAPAAMIAVISASRPISHIESFNKDVVLFALDPANTIGDALRLAKRRTSVSPCIGLMGDPALRLSLPENRVVVTHINEQPVEGVDSVKADVLSRVTVSGEVRDGEGQLIADFDGTVYPVVYDREMRTTTLANDNAGTEVAFYQQKSVLYKGTHSVEGGRFEYSFIVPRDVSYRYDFAKLSHYAKSGSDQATGSFGRLMLGGMSDSNFADATAPEIRLYIDDTNFRAGCITGSTPTLLALFSDSAGINVGTGLGHDITAVVDDNPNSLIVLNDLYQPDIADGRKGSVTYTLPTLAPGRHTVTVKAWNIFGLSSSATVSFVVYRTGDLTFSDLDCYPNPAVDVATFEARVNDPGRVSDVELQVYNSRGQVVFTAHPEGAQPLGPVHWDVTHVAPGLYLARMVVTDTDGDTHQITSKCIVR